MDLYVARVIHALLPAFYRPRRSVPEGGADPFT
jgi:hypothetical protein